MADAPVQFELRVCDLAAAELERLLADLGAVASEPVIADPVITAAEAAVAAVTGLGGELPIGEAALSLMPPNATPFERGLAVGMAIVLAVRPGRA